MRALTITSVFFLFASAAVAQLDRATITGAVTDTQGAAIPHAKVAAENTETRSRYETTSNSLGQYALPNLPVGPYTVSFTALGFRKLTQGGIAIKVTDVARVDATLQVGTLTESIEVIEELPRLASESPEVGTDMDHKTLVDLPLSFGNKRTPEDFAYLITPGVAGDNWEGRVNGSTNFGHETILDGASASTNRAGNFEQSPSMEALQEFRVQTSGISAEFGRVQAGLFNYVMKSGANRVHGSAYAEFRNEVLNANTFTNKFYGRPRDPDSKQNLAFSFGGPVYLPKLYHGRDKTFFYASYERYRVRQFSYGAPNLNVPVPEFYEGDFSRLLTFRSPNGAPVAVGTDALGNTTYQGQIFDPLSIRQVDGRWVADAFVGNRIPKSRFSEVARKVNAIAQKHYLPTVKDAAGNYALEYNAFFPTSSLPINDQHQFSIKLDRNISDRQKLSGSYSRGTNPRKSLSSGLWDPAEPDGGPFAKTQDLLQAHQFVRVNHDYTVTSHLLNHVTLSFNRFRNWIVGPYQDKDGAAELGIKGLTTRGYPIINWGGGPNLGLANPGYQQYSFIAYNQMGALDTVSFSKGRHFMKAGIDVRRNQMNYRLSNETSINFSAAATSIPNDLQSGRNLGYAFASYLLGIVNSMGIEDPWPTGDRRHYYAAFFQDDFKATKRLTLNLGVRWDYAPPGFEVNNQLSSWSPDVRDPVSGLMGAYQFTGTCPVCTSRNYFGTRDDKDFGPRIGFAFQITPKWIARGAYGIFYEGDFFGGLSTTFLGKQTSIQSGGTWSLQADPIEGWKGLYNWDGTLPANRYTPGPKYDVSWGNKNRPGAVDPRYGLTPYMQQWNFNIQRYLARRTKLDIGYVGNKGTRLRAGEMALVNQLPYEMVVKYGRNLTNPVRNAADAAANGIAYPFPGFTGTVASALRQYPQVQGNSTVGMFGTPLGFSTYHSLQVVFNREFYKGVSVYSNYVWSKQISNVRSSARGGNSSAADYYNLGLEKSIGYYDQPHMFKTFFVWELPVGKGKGILGNAPAALNYLVGGWTVTGILNYFSGMPIGFPASNSPYGWNGGGMRANVAAGPLNNPGFDKSKFNYANLTAPENLYLNPSKVTDTTPLSFGTGAPRYAQLRGFGTINENAGIQKNMRFGERYRVQLRAEMMNVFNRHQLGGIENRLWTPRFGMVTSVSGFREAQMGARLDF